MRNLAKHICTTTATGFMAGRRAAVRSASRSSLAS
ncbi:MAG: hypothetical protein QOH43_1306 [Solirubrobacteraceae bacterium]|jgi:hypothetical protein|nr:hypothetical protein [Solirubrobacteraceae bacterium]